MRRMSAPSAMDTAISIEELSKRYGRLTAVKDLRLDVLRGEVFGFLGLNGSGKTTTIRILLDLLRPTSGRASVFGFDCQSRGLEARARLGYLPGEMGIYSDMTGRQVLDFLARLKRRNIDQKYRRELQDRLALSSADLARRLREYSTGMKQKLGLIQAFQDDAELLILDEPTEGLDPLMQEAFYELLADVKAKGRTVFMSSHVLSEVERVCDRVGLLRRGELVLLSPVEEIRNLAARRVRVIFSEDVTHKPDLAPGHELLETEPRGWTLRVNGPLGPLLGALFELPVSDLMVEEPHLEDVILKYYREGDE
jgi:ABC-2 type transport system ATP-binding protein